MDSIRGKPTKLFEAALRELDDPIATLPSAGLCLPFCRALDRVGDASARVLLAEDEDGRLDWRTQTVAADHRYEGRLGLRSARTTDALVVGTERAYALDTTTLPSTAVASRLDGERPVAQRWALGERLRLDAPPRSQLVAETRETVGDTAATAVTNEIRRGPARRRGPPGIDPVKLLLWSGAAEGARVSRVKTVIERMGLGSRQLFERRLDVLEDEELVATPTINDGERGRPERQLSVPDDLGVADPTSPPDWVRAALL
ncbi:DUF5821 family protein [Halobaculum sp. MBLA0143]|uniref:transcriptional regulator TbsP domain-containing protein n=1 Tax=Halobaculum sp. MBLA0143 TaxID=3079933 RepID=UPI0035242897